MLLQKLNPTTIFFGILVILATGCSRKDEAHLNVHKNAHIILIGNNLGSRMMNFGHFETEMHLRYPDSLLYIRNMCDGGNTPGFRPHSGRPVPGPFREPKNSRPNSPRIPTAKVFMKPQTNGSPGIKPISSLLSLAIMNLSREKQGLENYKANWMHLSNIL